MGFDGYSDSKVGNAQHLGQDGFSMACVRGKADYYVWYEVLPAWEVRVDTATPLVAGDFVDTSVAFENGRLHFVVYVQHWATGVDEKPIDLRIPYKGQGKTAECIYERPTMDDGNYAKLPAGANPEPGCIIQYGPSDFLNLAKPPAKWNIVHLTMVNSLGKVLATSSVKYLSGSNENDITFVRKAAQ